MIPYFEQPTINLGPLSLNTFGALVMTGILLAVVLIRQRAKFLGLDVTLTERMMLWVLVTAFIMAHIVERLAYYPVETWEDPVTLLRIWDGMSSYGGFFGAVLGYLLVCKVFTDEV